MGTDPRKQEIDKSIDNAGERFWSLLPILLMILAVALGSFLTIPVMVLYFNTVKNFWFG